MNADLTLRLDDFGRQQLERYAQRRRGSQSAAVRTASLYYFADRRRQRPAWHVPAFVSTSLPANGVTVRLDDDTRGALTEEADRQGVPPGTLAAHVVLYFLTDLECPPRRSGRNGLVRSALRESFMSRDLFDFRNRAARAR
jgi:predicted transcriptional regulator